MNAILSTLLLIPVGGIATIGICAWRYGHKRTALTAWLVSLVLLVFSLAAIGDLP